MLYQALAAPAPCNFEKTPLRDALAQLADRCNIEVFLDRKSLQNDKISDTSSITVQGAALSLEQALQAVLGPARLTWAIRDDMLFITTKAGIIEHCMETRV